MLSRFAHVGQALLVVGLATVALFGFAPQAEASYTYTAECSGPSDGGGSYTVTCYAQTQNNNGGGNVNDTASVSVSVPGDVATNGVTVVSASARNIGEFQGPGFGFSVACANQTTCSDNGTRSVSASPGSSFGVSIRREGSGGFARAELTFRMEKLALPTVSVTANSTDNALTVPYGGAATVSWSSTSATSCTGSGSFSPNGPVNTSGSASIPAVTQSMSFTVSCNNARGSANDTVTVTPGAQPTLSNLSPGSGLAGTQVTITGTAIPTTGNTVTLVSASGTATPIAIPTASATSATFTVPTELGVGAYTVTMTNATIGAISSSQPLTFTVILPSQPLTCVTSDPGKQGTDTFENFPDGTTSNFDWRTITYPNTSVSIKKDQGKSGNGLVLMDTNATAGYQAHALAERQIKQSSSGSISFDVKPSQTTGRFTFVLGGAKGDFFYGYLGPTGTVEVWNDAITSGSNYVRVGTATYTANEWVSIKLDWNGTSKSVDLSLNGTKLNSQPLPYSYLGNASDATYFQAFTGHGESWAGTYAIDSVIYPGCVGLTLSVNPTSGTVPLAVTASAANTAADAALTWDFGDGSASQTGTQTSAAHTYQTAGTYTLKLTAGERELTQPIVVREQPLTPSAPSTFSLALSPLTGPWPLEVLGSVTGATATDLLRWDFGDGITKETKGNESVKHTFSNPGTYTVTVLQGTQRASATVKVTGEESAPIVRVMKLASTGGSLTINLAIATLLSLGTTYALLRRKTVAQ